jgi:D-arabinose 1-dehydrogenase-like Zn-dependent alcohol dehydrogenase
VWNALETAGVDMVEGGGEGMRNVVSGAGVGHLRVQFAAKLGCEVVAVDAGDAAIELVREVVTGVGMSG